LEECVRSVSMPGLFWGACEDHNLMHALSLWVFHFES
jgi:hypothetical protein